MPALKDVTIVNRKNRCLTSEVRSVIDKKYFLEGIVIAVNENAISN